MRAAPLADWTTVAQWAVGQTHTWLKGNRWNDHRVAGLIALRGEVLLEAHIGLCWEAEESVAEEIDGASRSGWWRSTGTAATVRKTIALG